MRRLDIELRDVSFVSFRRTLCNAILREQRAANIDQLKSKYMEIRARRNQTPRIIRSLYQFQSRLSSLRASRYKYRSPFLLHEILETGRGCVTRKPCETVDVDTGKVA